MRTTWSLHCLWNYQSTESSANPETLESMTTPKSLESPQLPKTPQAPPVPHTGSPLNKVTLGPGLRMFESKLYDLQFGLTRRNMP